MTAPPFDGPAYRRNVLTTLRERNPAEIEDLFWLADVPRAVDDEAAIAERLKAARGFLFKERTRARQAAVAQAVLGEWPRIEATLLDAASRAALRRRLEQAGEPVPGVGERPKPPPPPGGDRRRRQVSAALGELARLRDDPDLGSDLFAFLGLPTSATRDMLSARIDKISEVNRRRRPDRERTLVDDLLAHARKLLLEGDPAAYLAGFDDEFRDGVVDALQAGDVDAARTALAAARSRGVSDAAILARLDAARAGAGPVIPLSALGLGTFCPVCETVAPPGATACPNCHSGLQVRCESCTQLVAADLVRCSNCGALLDDARAPLLARRATLRAETDALAQVDAAPAGERAAQLRALARAHPDWQQVQRRLASLPPSPPRNVRVAIEYNEALLSWEAVEGADAYLVERHGPQGSRVLGRTSLLEFSDAAPKVSGITWTVRALRGQSASSEPVTASADGAPTPEPEPDTPGVKELVAIAGRPVVLSWRAPEGAAVTLTRRRDDVTRTISPDPDGYVDRKVQAGATYEYTVAIDGVAGSERSTTVTVPSDAQAVPQTAAAPAVSELVVRRRDDGRVEATWTWPEGTTEVFVAWDRTPPKSATSAPGGRKITNTRYEIDGGAALDGVPPGAHVAIFTGTRSPAGTLEWSVDAPPAARRLVP